MADGWVASRGDSRAISFTNGLRSVLPASSDGVSEASSASMSVLGGLLEGLDSWLGSRRKPILPSFSMATKLVRTFESGLGESELADPLAVSAPGIFIGGGDSAYGLEEASEMDQV